MAEQSFVFRVTAGAQAFILKEVGTINPHGNVPRKLAADLAAWQFLHSEGIPVALPISTDNDQTYIHSEGHYYCLFPELPSNPDPAAPLEQVQVHIGAAIARLHRALAAYTGKIYSWTMDLPPRILEEAVPVILRHLEPDERVRLETVLAKVSEPLRRALVELPAQYLHGDCHAGNILLVGDQVSGFIDMDHMPFGPRLYDLCYHASGKALYLDAYNHPEKDTLFFEQILPALFHGYENVSPLTAAEKDAAPYMMIGIELIMAGWMFEPANNPEWARNSLALLYWLHENTPRIRAKI